MSVVTTTFQDPTVNVTLHSKVQEYLTGQGKGRSVNTINNAWHRFIEDKVCWYRTFSWGSVCAAIKYDPRFWG